DELPDVQPGGLRVQGHARAAGAGAGVRADDGTGRRVVPRHSRGAAADTLGAPRAVGQNLWRQPFRVACPLSLFLELLFADLAEAGRGAKGFAIVVERKAADVPRVDAAGRLALEHDEHGTAGRPVAESDAAAARQTSRCEAFEHGTLQG